MSRRRLISLLGLAALAALLLLWPRSGDVPPRAPAARPTSPTPAAPAAEAERSDPKAPAPALARRKTTATDPLAGLSLGIRACPPDSPADFVLRDRRVSAFFDEKGVALAMVGRAPGDPAPRRHALRWSVAGAEEVTPRAEGELKGRVNAYLGERAAWAKDQKTYGSVVYDEVRPGVDLHVDARPHAYKYTLQAERARDLEGQRFRYEGARAVRVADGGAALEIETPIGSLREDGLRVWQDLPEGRREIEARYVAAEGDTYEIAFAGHDPDAPLTLDPVLTWTSFLGGLVSPQGEDQSNALAVDPLGNSYVVGYTYCLDFPVAGFSVDTTAAGDADGFLMKVRPDGVREWATYLGGKSFDYANAVAFDPVTNGVVVVGYTQSDDFPAVGPVFDPLPNGSDAFVTKFDPASGGIVWSTFLGGSSYDGAKGVAVDAFGEIYVTGFTGSADFPTRAASDGTLGGGQDAFVVCVKANGQDYNWSTYLGGSDYDEGNAVAVAGTSVYVAGQTTSTNFPTAGGLFSFKGGQDGFLTRFGLGGALGWSTYLGGAGEDSLTGVAVTGGEPVVVGYSSSPDYPLVSAYDGTLDGFNDVVVTRVKASGTALTYSTFLGGSSSEYGHAIAAGTLDSVVITGYTFSTFSFPQYPTTAGAYRTSGVGSAEAFVTRLNGSGFVSASTYLGGGLYDQGRGIASVNSGTAAGVYVSGYTQSPDFPQANPPPPIFFPPDPALEGLGGQSDGFVVRLSAGLGALTWNGFVGGNVSPAEDYPQAVAAANEPDVVYVAGYTYALDFPTNFSLNFPPGMLGQQDGFITRVRYDGISPFIEWSAFVGGSDYDAVYGIAVDGNDSVYLTGFTSSFDFPLANPEDPFGDGGEAFLLSLDRFGNLNYSTYLGGGSTDYGRAVAVNDFGEAVVVGYTYSFDFPLINPFDPSYTGFDAEGFVAKFSPFGSMMWSSFLGGSGFDHPASVAASADDIFITGYTSSGDFVTIPSPDSSFGGQTDAFVVSLRQDGVLRWSRYLGDTQDDIAYCVSTNRAGTTVAVTGYTYSPAFPVLNAADPSFSGFQDAFLTRLDPASGNLVWSTFVGGSSYEYAQGVDVDEAGDIFLAGHTLSYDFPLRGAFQTTPQGGWDLFVAKVFQSGALAWSTLLGGSNSDYGTSISVESSFGTVYVTGNTYSSDFPMINPFDPTLDGPSDGFLLRIDNADPNPPDFSFIGAGQFRQDGTTAIPVGGWTRQTSVFVRARVTDSDDQPVRLQVEMKPLGTAFNGTTGLSTGAFVSAGSLAQVTVPLSGAPQQFHYQVRAEDFSGRFSSWVSFGNGNLESARDLGFDTAASAPLFSTPTTGADHHTTSSSIGLTGTASDDASGVASVSYFNNLNSAGGGASGTTSWTVASVSLSAGVNPIRITVTDVADNSAQAVLNVIRDNAAPSISILSPAVSPFLTNASFVALSGNASDAAPGVLNTVTWSNSLGGSGAATFGSGTWSANVTGLSPGDNVVTVTATDRAGNSTFSQITIRRDTLPPTVAIAAPAANFTTGGASVAMSGSASDNVGFPANGITWKNVTTGASGTASGTTTWSVAAVSLSAGEGANVLEITATDSVGLTATTSVTVFRDLNNPSATITLPASDPFNTGATSVALSGTASDAIAVTAVEWSNAATGGSGTATLGSPNTPSTSWSVASIPLATGANLITVTARDRITGHAGTDTITVNRNASAPSLAVTNPPSTPFVTPLATIVVAGSAGDDLGVSTMTLLNGATPYPVVTSDPLPDTAFTWTSSVTLTPGTNTVTVSAGDGSDTTAVVLTIIYDPDEPDVKISAPTSADAYATGLAALALAGTASDNRGVVEVRWTNSAGGAGVADGTSSWSIASIALADGPQTITVTAKDEAGNETSDVLTVTRDDAQPDVAITAPSVAETFTTLLASVSLGGTVTDNYGVGTVTWSNAATGASGTASGSPNWTAAGVALNPGDNLITVLASDGAGNLRADTILVRRDTLVPAVAIGSPSVLTTNSGTVVLAGSASDDVEVASVAWANAANGTNGAATGTTSWSVPSFSLEPGNNLVTVTATDVVGRVNTAQITIHYDDQAPAVAITSPGGASTSTTGTPIDLGGTMSDVDGGGAAAAVASVRWDNLTTGGTGASTLGAGTWSASVPLTSGLNTVRMTATDLAGNASTAQILVTYDPAAPLVTINVPTTDLNFSTASTPITVAGVVSDDVGVASVAWASSGAVLPNTGAATLTGGTDWSAAIPLAAGINVITITATDTVGRTGTRRITITYDPTPPSVAITQPTSSPTYLTTVTPLSLGGAASDNQSVRSVTWSNAATAESGAASGTGLWTVGAINLAPGANTITVTATDAVGNTGTAQVVVTYDGVAPALSISTPTDAPTTSTSTRPIALGGPVTDNLLIASVTWTNSLGGGGTATLTGSSTSATWNASVYLFPGDNVITVTAVDGHGQSVSDVLTVTFTPENVAPSIVITGPSSSGSAASATQSAVLSGTADDNVGIVAVGWENATTGVRGAAALTPGGGGPVVTWTADVPLADGDNLILATATDDAGNTTFDTISISFAAPSDAIPPAVTISGPTLLDLYDSSVSPLLITLAATDNVGVASVVWSNASTGGAGTGTLVAGSTWTVSVALAVGANTVTVSALDPAGNSASDVLIVNFTPPPGDIAAPLVLITSHPTTTTLEVAAQPLSLAGTTSDDTSVAGVVWLNATAGVSGGADGTIAWTSEVTLVPGINLITMRAYDTSGNTDTDQITVLYSPPPPPPEHVGAGNCGLTGLELLLLLPLLRRRR